MKSLSELRAERETLMAEANEIAALADPTDDQFQRGESLLEEVDGLDRAIHDAKIDAIRVAANNPANTEHGADEYRGGAPDVMSRTAAAAYDDTLRRSESFVGMPGEELLRRSDGALEVLRARGVPQESLDRLAALAGPQVDDEPYEAAAVRRAATARMVLAASDPVYERAFRKLLRRPSVDAFTLTDDDRRAVARANGLRRELVGADRVGDLAWGDDSMSRAALSLSNANGGYLVPFTLDPTIILNNNGSANPWRQVARSVRTATNTWNGVTSTGVNAAWLAEAGVVGDNSPTFGNLQITPQKAAAWVFGSYEVLEDSDFEQQLPGLLADAKDRLESAAFATGSGSGQPFGAVTRATATALAGGTITTASVYQLHQALSPRFRDARPFWAGNVAALDLLRQTPIFTGAQRAIVEGGQMVPFGEPAYEASDMDGVISTGGHKVLMYADGNQYVIVDRIGMSVLYEPMIKDTSTGRPTGQGGWFAFWRVGADSTFGANSPAIRVLSLT